MSSGRKRDRWDSSSDEEEGGGRSGVKSELSAGETKKTNTSSSPVVTADTDAEAEAQSQSTVLLAVRKHNPLLQGCRLVYSSYERIARLDEGTYGIVWKAKDTSSGEIVALKQIKFDETLTKEGFPIAALREISVLLDLSHECIVTVREMVVGDNANQVFMVMEFMQMDLKDAIERSGQSPFPQSELKNMMYQILSAIAHVHEKWYLHRDMKTSNILVHKSGKIALCDFGLARKYQTPLKAMTQMVVTLWYRPPELLYGESIYGPAVDMWSVGCIFGELLKKKALMEGQGELDQINKIIELVGAPTETNWPDFQSLPNAKMFRWRSKGPPTLPTIFPVNTFTGGQTYLDPNGFDLLSKLLTLDPKQRISGEEALKHKYFSEGVERQVPRFSFD
jgi:cell division cycle 2-like protein